jgi:hypothetical protein
MDHGNGRRSESLRTPRRRSPARFRVALLAAGALALGGCMGKVGSPMGGSGAGPGGGGTGGDTGPTGPERFPFEAFPPEVYAAKVKSLTTGLPLTDVELGSVLANPAALRGLIGTWTAQPEWRAKLLDFFMQSFQQTQVTDAEFYNDLVGRDLNNWVADDQTRFLRAAEQSMARTVLALMDEGRPFTEAVTTRRFMLNPPLMAVLAYMDAAPRNDTGRAVNSGQWLTTKYPMMTFVRTANIDATTLMPTPIPLAETLDPASPNFMRWYDPTAYTGTDMNCMDPVTRTGNQAVQQTFDLLFGGRPGCGRTVSQWTVEDWDSWRMVTIRPPAAGEERTIFWDLPKLKNAATTELVLNTPRVGFMTTPAFFANWPTNPSNSYRVTTNQTMIVALGRSFDDRDTTVQATESSDDSMHVQPGTTCYGCHTTLDPMRDFFRQSYSVVYSQQLGDLNRLGIPAAGTFNIDGGTPVSGAGVGALADAVATHPRFAVAWAQKLCAYANSVPCDEADPELQRVARVFVDSGFRFDVLVTEILSSPLVTFAKETLTAMTKGVSVGITRREPLCGSLESRTGLLNACGLRTLPAGTTGAPTGTNLSRARNLALSIPGAGYARGDDKPLLPHDPNMFFTAATDNLCLTLAGQLVDVTNGGRWVSTDVPAALRDFVSVVIGMPGNDPRFEAMLGILNEHYTEAMAAQGSSRTAGTNALRSTFILACASPLGTSTGL